MQSVKRIKLHKRKALSVPALGFLFLFSSLSSGAQENSPYSRYGLGDVVPNTNITTRGMGGISAGYADVLSVNFNNPASYSAFQARKEARTNKLENGRVVLDVGVNLSNRTLRNPNQPEKFTTSNALFSYIQLGVPLRRNWGLSFGLRPLTRIGYKVVRGERLVNPATGAFIDSAQTEFSGNGGSFLPSIGTGFAIGKLSVGANMGYLFGRKEYSSKRAFVNDSIAYASSSHTTSTFFGDLYFTGGAQYLIKLATRTNLRLGVSGNLKQKLNARQDVLRGTFVRTGTTGDQLIDTVQNLKDVSGEIVYPASYTAGFTIERHKENNSGWLFGADFVQNKWSDYRFFGQADSLQDTWQLRVGGQITPTPGANYFSRVGYRAGFGIGPDYIKVGGNDLPLFTASFGMALPIGGYNRMSPFQFSVVNVSLEYNKRGNNENALKENTFRASVGFNFSDLWFSKRKYD